MDLVEDRVTGDLTANQESVFQVLALNPSLTLKEIGDKYNCKPERIQVEVRGLESQNLIKRIPEGVNDDLMWEVTEVGRLRLLKLRTNTRFDRMEAMVREKDKETVKLLELKRTLFEKAYKQSKELFESG
jgi:DNA-binding MarR family transcriptional regulator